MEYKDWIEVMLAVDAIVYLTGSRWIGEAIIWTTKSKAQQRKETSVRQDHDGKREHTQAGLCVEELPMRQKLNKAAATGTQVIARTMTTLPTDCLWLEDCHSRHQHSAYSTFSMENAAGQVWNRSR
ncbi:expressed unknown protein [Seminavis robusta]|uniref:Uncharacterized protein n=1 Tax=Seminavis robusta TaxID=568900 RepID=A0A9N8DVR2_9STRA|nr:expressed unknown protein [Seminavis robusta]|eukprot:Sro408_g136950.1 n/a (126) ;mRNA; r:34086-34463